MALDRRAVLPLRAEIALPEDASLVTGTVRCDLGQLAGRALKTSSIGMFASGSDDTSDRATAEWIIHAPTGTEVEVTLRHDRAGTSIRAKPRCGMRSRATSVTAARSRSSSPQHSQPAAPRSPTG
jgi:hypothetical protein